MGASKELSVVASYFASTGRGKKCEDDSECDIRHSKKTQRDSPARGMCQRSPWIKGEVKNLKGRCSCRTIGDHHFHLCKDDGKTCCRTKSGPPPAPLLAAGTGTRGERHELVIPFAARQV